MKRPSTSVLAPVLLATALAALVSPFAFAEDLPILTGEKSNLTGGITPAGDVDEFRLDLFPGDRATVKVKSAGPIRGLISTLALAAPDGDPIAVTINKQGSPKPSFAYDATEAGIHVVTLTGDPGGFGGAAGNYTIATKIKRVKPDKVTLANPAGGTFLIPVRVGDGGLVDVKLVTKKGGFDIEGLFRPDGRAEPGFVESLKKKKERRSAKGKKFPVTGGFGTYLLRGTFDAGSSVKATVKVRYAGGTRKARLGDAEPSFDPFLAPFPSSGVSGTVITVVGKNLEVGRGNSTSTIEETFDDAAGGEFVTRFGLVAESLLSVDISATGGGFDIDALDGPNDRSEPLFLNALTLDERTRATTPPTAPFRVTRGTGFYELRGQYDAGARVTIEIDVVRGDGADPDAMPRVWVGGSELPSIVIENPFDQVLRFPAPDGLTPDAMYDIEVRNNDGQGAVAPDAFYYVPAPSVSQLTATEAGPAGGRSFRILGRDFRQGSVVLFDGMVVQPSFVLSNRIDIVAPPHAPGDVFPVVRDDLGQTAQSPMALTYLDIPSNAITSVSPAVLQGIGGEAVTVTGMDFGIDSVLSLDGRPVDAQLVSATEMTLVAPDHAAGTVELRVQDDYEQSSSVDVEIIAFIDASDASIPAPKTGTGVVDSWRTSHILSGLVDDDQIVDLVLVRAAAAFGDEVDRPRVRILIGDGSGGYTDGTDGIPDISATDDYRARDAALVDANGDGDLDLLLLTDELLDSGNRSSLRLLLNDGDGTFTDVTATSMPGATTAGDHNQGVSLVVANVDGQNGDDVVIINTEFFQETIDESPPLGNPPPEPPPPPVFVTYYYPGTRVLLNNGSGVFTRDDAALPTFDGDSIHGFEGKAIAAADVDDTNGVDLVLTDDDVREDPTSPGTFLRRAVLLLNDGSGAFTDASATWLPTGAGAEYLQGDGIDLVDYDANGDPDLVVFCNTQLVNPSTGMRADVSAFRIFENDGSGFAAVGTDVIPDPDDQDALQCQAAAFGDLTGDGRLDVFLVSPSAPNVGDRAGRVLVWAGDRFVRGNEGLPDALSSDNGRGRDVLLHDTDGDGDLDAVIGRDESDQSVRNTRVFRNPRLE